MRIAVSYPSAALLHRILTGPKQAAAAEERPLPFADAMDAALAAQSAVAAVLPPRAWAAGRSGEKKGPRRRNEGEAKNARRNEARERSLWA